MKKDKRKEYAKDLYTTYNEDGSKSFSLREIASKVLQKFGKNLTGQTVKNWATKYDWNKLNEKIKQEAIAKASNENFTTEERIIEAKSDKLAVRFKHAETIANVGVAVIQKAYQGESHALISVRDAIQMFKMGTEIEFRINEIPENHNIKNTIELTKQQIVDITKELDELY